MNIITLTKRNDGSYVVNGVYHVPNTPEFRNEYAQCTDYEQNNPELVGLEQEQERPSFEVVQAAKRQQINAGFESALIASLTMPSANTPSAVEVAVGAAALAAVDPDGPAYIMQTHTARRDSMLAAVDAATSVEAVQAITVSYAV